MKEYLCFQDIVKHISGVVRERVEDSQSEIMHFHG